MVGIVLRFVIRQFWVVNVNYFLDPVVRAIWDHTKLGHPRSPLKCAECAHRFYDLPE